VESLHFLSKNPGTGSCFPKFPFSLSENPGHFGQGGPTTTLARQPERRGLDLNEIAIATYIEDPGQVVMGNHGFPPPE